LNTLDAALDADDGAALVVAAAAPAPTLPLDTLPPETSAAPRPTFIAA